MARQSFTRVIGDRARRDPDEVVVISDHEDRVLSAGELDAHSNRLAREYLAKGVRRDDLVAISMSTGVGFVLACVAAWKAGATPHPVSPQLPAAERAELELIGRPALAVGAAPVDRAIPWLPTGFASDQPDTAPPETWPRCWKAPTSSGSTGRPKIVRAQAPALIDPDQPVAAFLPRRAVQLVTAPLWHSASFTYAFRGLLTGHRLVLTAGFDEHRFVDLVNRYQVSWALLSPSSIHRLVRLPDRPPLDSLASVLHLGAPCAPDDKRALIDWLGADKVIEVYAGSESNGLTMITGRAWLRKPGSVGTPIGGTEIRILRSDGSQARAGEPGQVWLRRGSAPAYSYLGAPSKRTEDGWDTLGDIGFLDADGDLTIIDRAADIIFRDGTAVYPSRVEHALESHPGVRGAVVYGHLLEGAQSVAAVVDIGDATVETASVHEHVRTRLAPAEVPATIHLTRSLLRNDAGKVRRSTFRTHQAPISTMA